MSGCGSKRDTSVPAVAFTSSEFPNMPQDLRRVRPKCEDEVQVGMSPLAALKMCMAADKLKYNQHQAAVKWFDENRAVQTKR